MYHMYLIRSSQVFSFQLLSAIDAATNSLRCSLSYAMLYSVILCLPDVFPNLVTLALLRSSSTQQIHLFDRLPLDLFPLGCHQETLWVILQSFLCSICPSPLNHLSRTWLFRSVCCSLCLPSLYLLSVCWNAEDEAIVCQL